MSSIVYVRRIIDAYSDAGVIRALVEAIEDAERGVITLAELAEVAREARL